jgi:hypothetical protein
MYVIPPTTMYAIRDKPITKGRERWRMDAVERHHNLLRICSISDT